MEASIDMNNNTLNNVKDPEGADQATNKKYVDNQLEKKLDKVTVYLVNSSDPAKTEKTHGCITSEQKINPV